MTDVNIPNQFHFVFGLRPQRQPFHLAHYLCLESCLQVNRPKAIYFYYQHEPYGSYWDAIRPKLKLERVGPNQLVTAHRYKEASVERYRYAHHADFIRLEKVIERGGIYADIDTLFVRPFPAELYKKTFVLGKEGEIFDRKTNKPRLSLCNALIMCAPGAEFGRRWLEGMSAHFDGSWSNHSTLLPQELAEQFPDLIHLEPQRSFYFFPPSRAGFAALFEDKQPIPNDVYSIHLWQHLWWDRGRVDFTEFHQGLLTREYVAKEETTYSAAARPFLPPQSLAHTEAGIIQRLVEAARNASAKVESELRCGVALAVYPYVRKFWPRAKEGLRLAGAHRAYVEASKRLVTRNAVEAVILRNVIESDEYGIFYQRLNPEDVVIDVGAHIGAFSWAAYWQGSRNIHAYEAEPSNFAVLEGNLKGLRGISVNYGAVFSNVAQLNGLTHSGHVFSNTGGGSVIFGDNLFAFHNVGHLKPNRELKSTPVISFDEVLSKFGRVRLLKLDCEGSEYPILLTSKLLHKIDRIAGEYHVIDEERMRFVVPEAQVEGHRSFNGETIRALLTAQGFEVTLIAWEELGLFNAVRRTAAQSRAGEDGSRPPD